MGVDDRQDSLTAKKGRVNQDANTSPMEGMPTSHWAPTPGCFVAGARSLENIFSSS